MTDTTDDAVTLETAMIRFGIRNDLNCTGEPRMTTERQHTAGLQLLAQIALDGTPRKEQP